MHPHDGRMVSVYVDYDMTAQEAIYEMLAADFIPPNREGYNLAIKGGAQLQPNQSFGDAGAKSGDIIRTSAGGPGRLAYFLPSMLKLGQSSRCFIRISPEDLADYMLLHGFVDNAFLKSIDIAAVMQVNLQEITSREKLLKIHNLSGQEQQVLDHTYSEWLFDLDPIKIGRTVLFLKVNFSEIPQGYQREVPKVVFSMDQALSVEEGPIRSTQSESVNREAGLSSLYNWNIYVKIEIERLIRKNNTELALAELTNHLQRVDLELHKALLLLHAQWNAKKDDYQLGLIDQGT